MTVCVECFVSGRVQGVFFRDSTRQQALSLALTGYARNLPDGRVKVLVCGDHKSVTKLQAWLWQGPPHADVKDIKCNEASVEIPTGFVIG